MEHEKRCIFFLWCIVTTVINGRQALHVQPSAGIGRLQTGTSLHVLEMYKSYSDAEASEQQLRYGPTTTIRSFSGDGERLAKGLQLYDVTIPNEEKLVDAELHYFISESIFQLADETDSLKLQLFIIQEDLTEELLEERTVRANDFGWQVFNVKSTIKKWQDSPNQNQGFKVIVLDSSEKDISSEMMDSWQGSYEPVLIVFSRDLNLTESLSQSIDSHISNKVNSMLRGENMHIPWQIARKTRSVTNDTKNHNNLCQRHELWLTFEEIGWSFIIYPTSFDASFCSGVCKDLGDATFHNLALCRAYETGKISKENTQYCEYAPTCIPIKYEPLRVIYQHNDSYVSETLPRMVATDCGCQKN